MRKKSPKMVRKGKAIKSERIKGNRNTSKNYKTDNSKVKAGTKV